jgi:hypothetical protein|tara:strand:+ start:4373 stop:4495 length:123 start_codon:yes stop_codon:yes gene_type:complete
MEGVERNNKKVRENNTDSTDIEFPDNFVEMQNQKVRENNI